MRRLITQASRDGGVDAIAFDPDPIRGSKIVIQAKRYTNTVLILSEFRLFVIYTELSLMKEQQKVFWFQLLIMEQMHMSLQKENH